MRLTRREFLKGLGAAVGGVSVVSGAYNHLIPFIHQPEDIIPGASTWYATSCRECPAGCAMLLRCVQARVVKCEGNPLQPISRGALCARGQAALHGLYDPDRIKQPLRRIDSGEQVPVSWNTALDQVANAVSGGKRIAFISDLQTGSLDALMRTWLGAFGSRTFVVYEPINYESVKAVSGGVVPSYSIQGSDYLISFAADFLETWISPIEYATDFSAMRTIRNGARGGFAYVGPRVSMTAANADRRMVIRPGDAQVVAYAIASEAGRAPAAGFTADMVGPRVGVDPDDIRAVGRALAASRAPLALPGLDTDSARAAAFINSTFGSTLVNTGRPHAVTGIAPRASMDRLISAMDGGGVDVLIVYSANPVFSLPRTAHFTDALKRVPMVISLSSYRDETTVHANWVLPSSTPLENWGDYTPYPDVSNLMQPTMGRMHNTRHTGDILIELATRAGLDPAASFGAATFYDYLRLRWGAPVTTAGSEAVWESYLQQGGRWAGVTPGAPGATPANGYNTGIIGAPRVGPGGSPVAGVVGLTATAVPPVKPSYPVPALTPAGGGAAPAAAAIPPVTALPTPSKRIRLYAFPHPYYYDGRNANRRWLQETPEPVTKAVWGTWAEIEPGTAERLGVNTDDIIEIDNRGAKIRVPVYVREGIAPNVVAVPIGEGHTHYGRFAEGTGKNVWPLLSSPNPLVKASATGDGHWVVRVQRPPGSLKQHGREIVQTTKLGEPFVREKEIKMPLPSGYKFMDFYPGHSHRKHRWAMVVDLDRCIGCHACVTACYAENNLAIVGPDGIWSRREMSWMRIDRYIEWEHKTAPILWQPMFCQHCDAAPCEPVCPVYAAAHSDEGINMQVYNRCVGTRYCSNNCPYKVRRFNWWDFEWPEPLNWQLNPDVTVRRRGVMEKCTFCIQRIRQGEVTALREKRNVLDGEITPACVQTCPTGVFTFGDLMDPKSRVSLLINTDPRAYQVLADLNTKTAVIYLKTVVEKA